MRTKIHAIAGVVGFLTIATFWFSTLFTELLGSPAAIATLKTGILWGMLILIPAMMIVGGSGISLAQGRDDPGVLKKKKRMPLIALNGMLVLLPAAVFLAIKARAGELDTVFYIVQGLELFAGAVNLSLMGISIRDGLRLTGRIDSTSRRATG